MTLAEASFDFVSVGDFSSAFVDVYPATDRAKELFRQKFGVCGVAPTFITFQKTKFSEFAVFAERNGFTVS